MMETNEMKQTENNVYKSKKILNEIYETEKTYQHHLMLLKTLFLDVIRISSVLPANYIDGIFSNVEAIQSVSLHLLKLMEEVGVIHALLRLAPYLKLYSLYANNFDHSNKLLEDCMTKYPEFERLVRLQENQEEMESLKLTALLVTPIQRVPRYCLLLGNLLEKSKNNDDYEKLKDAHNKLKQVATHINECVRQHENFHKMLSIQNRFIGGNVPQIMVPGRMFIKEGCLTKVNSRGQAKERVVFLFSDVLILAKKEGNGIFSCCETFLLKNCIVENVMGNNSDHGNGLFRIICDDKSILLCSKDDETSWILKIRNCVRELHTNLASLRRRSSESNIARVQQKERPRSKKNALKALTLAVPVAPNKMLRRQKTQSMEVKRSTVIFCDDDMKDMDGKPHFYHHNDSYGCSLSLSTSTKSDDEITREMGNVKKPSNPRRQNWSLTEPISIERRRPLRSIRESAKQVSDKLGCKRKHDMDNFDYSKNTSNRSEIENKKVCSDENRTRRVFVTVPKTPIDTTATEKGNSCIIM